MDNSSANIDLIRSHVDIIILKPLETQDRYGYEILREIETNSNGLFKLKQPTLYSCLKRLEKQGFINSYLGDESNGAQRRYYSLTQQGRDFLASQRAQWEFVRTILSGLVSDEEFDKENDVQPFDPSKYRPLTKRTRSDDEEENVKVVEKIVYVPQETEAKPLTSEEIKNQLSDEDINDIVQDYLKTHNIESNTTDQDSAHDVCTINDTVIEEDVSLDADDVDCENIQMSFDDLDYVDNKTEYEPPAPIKTKESEQFINELIEPQNNDIPTEEIAEVPPKEEYVRQEVTFDDLVEEKPKFASYKAEEPTQDELATYDKSYDEQPEDVVYNTYIEESKPQPNNVKDTNNSLFDYSSKIEEPKVEPKAEDNVNVFKALDRIYAVDDSPKDEDKEPIEEEQHTTSRYSSSYVDHYNTTTPDYNKIESISELKVKLQNEGFKVKPYTKINSSEFYINNYYYANRTARDTSLVMFAIFFIESLLAHFILATKFTLNFGYLALTWGVAALVPIYCIIKWAVNPYFKKPTRVSLKLSMMLSLIMMLNAVLVILLVGFFGFRVDYSDINTMILPVITPLIFLVNIPLYAMVYYLLYRSRRYNLR